MTRLFCSICVLGVAVGLCRAVVQPMTQTAVGPETSQNGVVLTKLSQPIYPPLARQTRIVGDVVLILGIRRDGSVESATVVSGHPLLTEAALRSAQQSLFECRKCDDAATSYRLLYTFQLVGPTTCCTGTEGSANNNQPDQVIPRVIQSQSHVTVVDQPVCICDPAADVVKVRSLKCLYLWKCGFRYPL